MDQTDKIADLQELCRRAHIILDAHWDDYVEEGYGPTSLLRDLEKASNGREVKDLRTINDLLYKICQRQKDQIKQLN